MVVDDGQLIAKKQKEYDKLYKAVHALMCRKMLVKKAAC